MILKEPGVRYCPETYLVKKREWLDAPEYTGINLHSTLAPEDLNEEMIMIRSLFVDV